MKIVVYSALLLAALSAQAAAQAPNDAAARLQKGVDYSRGIPYVPHRTPLRHHAGFRLFHRPHPAASPTDNSADQLNRQQLQKTGS